MYNLKNNNYKDACEYIKKYKDLYGHYIYFLEDVK